MIGLIVLVNYFDVMYGKQCDSFKNSAKVATRVEHRKKSIQCETRFAARLNTNEAKDRRQRVESFVFLS